VEDLRQHQTPVLKPVEMAFSIAQTKMHETMATQKMGMDETVYEK
jgi:hypothetical protein